MDLLRRPFAALALVALVTLVPRLVALSRVGPDALTPDGARLLNVARAVGRGEGFVTPECFPAWLAPARLPSPERLKEPGYPYAVAALTPLVRDPFRAAQALSWLAGLALPFALFALVRRLHPDRAVATLAALFAAGSPVLVMQSALVMAESVFALLLTLAFLAAEDARAAARPPSWGRHALAGALLGLAVLVRAQALVALPALLWRLWPARGRGGRAAPLAAALGLLAVLSPWLVRNQLVFGTPLPVESRLVGLLAYVDPLALTSSPDPPPLFGAWAAGHPAAVLAHAVASARRLVAHAVPGAVLGLRVWLVPLAIGLWVAVRERRAWGPWLSYQALTLALVLPINWPDRYLAAVAPLFAAEAGLGVASLLLPLERARGALRRLATPLALALCVVLLAWGVRAGRSAAETYHPELAAARAYGPWLRARLAPDEAVMGEITSFWAWHADRPAVCPVFADSARVEATLVRLKVRWAALALSRIDTLAARYPDRRLPRALTPVLEDRARDVRIYRVDVPARPAAGR